MATPISDTQQQKLTRPWTPAPSRIEKVLLLVFLLALIAFAINTVNRGAFLERPMTDAQIFFRGAWAAWSHVPLSEVTDDNGWHYNYHPPLAVMLRPFACEPAGRPSLPWTMPYPVSLLVWFVLGFSALAYAIVQCGHALDPLLGQRPWQQGPFHPWWLLRFGALMAFLVIAGSGLSRGQVTPFLLLSMTGFMTAYANRRPATAGIWLSLGITVKLFPVILICLPLLRRDRRCLTAVLGGSLMGLFVVPALLIGPMESLHLYDQWFTERLWGIVSGDIDRVVASELSPLDADMVGFGPVILRLVNLIARPRLSEHNIWTVAAHWICSLSLLMLILRAGYGKAWTRRSPQPGGSPAILLFSALITAAAVPIVTVSQVHYWTLGIPLYMYLVVDSWLRRQYVGLCIWSSVFGVLLWIGFLLVDLRRHSPLSSVGWLTFLLTGLILYGIHRLRQMAPSDLPLCDRTNHK